MATADPNVTALFECPVCMGQFIDPRILVACGHHFCRTCLEGIANLHPQGSVPCPSCRAITKFEAGKTVADLPRPVLVNELQQLMLTSKQNYNAEENDCDLCLTKKAGKRIVASHFCFQCHKTLCEGCLCKHRKVQLFEGHQTEALQNVTFCKTHRGEATEAFCCTCKTGICTQCLMEEHESHFTENLSKTVSGFTEKMTAFLGREKSSSKTTEMNIQATEETLESFKAQQAANKNRVSSLKQSAQKMLTKIAKVEQQLERSSREEELKIKNYLHELNALNTLRKRHCRHVEQIISDFTGENLITEALQLTYLDQSEGTQQPPKVFSARIAPKTIDQAKAVSEVIDKISVDFKEMSLAAPEEPASHPIERIPVDDLIYEAAEVMQEFDPIKRDMRYMPTPTSNKEQEGDGSDHYVRRVDPEDSGQIHRDTRYMPTATSRREQGGDGSDHYVSRGDHEDSGQIHQDMSYMPYATSRREQGGDGSDHYVSRVDPEDSGQIHRGMRTTTRRIRVGDGSDHYVSRVDPEDSGQIHRGTRKTSRRKRGGVQPKPKRDMRNFME